MAMLSLPVIFLVHGCEIAGSATITTPSRKPPTAMHHRRPQTGGGQHHGQQGAP